MQQMINKCCVLLGKKFGSFDRGLRTNIFPAENNKIHPNDTFHTISPVIEPFKRRITELEATHNSKKQIDTSMASHDLPSEIKAHEIRDSSRPVSII